MMVRCRHRGHHGRGINLTPPLVRAKGAREAGRDTQRGPSYRDRQFGDFLRTTEPAENITSRAAQEIFAPYDRPRAAYTSAPILSQDGARSFRSTPGRLVTFTFTFTLAVSPDDVASLDVADSGADTPSAP